jgi:hypothetical protein
MQSTIRYKTLNIVEHRRKMFKNKKLMELNDKHMQDKLTMNNAIPVPQCIEDVSYEWCLGKPAGYLVIKPAKDGTSKFGSVQYRCNANKTQHGKLFSMSDDVNQEMGHSVRLTMECRQQHDTRDDPPTSGWDILEQRSKKRTAN